MGFFFGRIFRFFLVIYVGVFFFLLVRPFPDDLEQTPVAIPVDPASVTFLADVTYTAENGAARHEETIFPAMISMVGGSNALVYLDMFLFNQFQGKEPETHRNQTTELANALMLAKARTPSSTVVMMTDPINRGYGGLVNPDLDNMEKAGVVVYETPLDTLRDPNLLWSTLYRMSFQWFGNTPLYGWLPNPLDAGGEKVTLRTYARLLNFKANHRKILVTDDVSNGERALLSLVGSLNSHTASSANGNTALLVRSTTLGERILSSESDLLALDEHPSITSPVVGASPLESGSAATYLTEANIEKSILSVIEGLRGGDDRLDIAMFYLSDRDIVSAIEKAGERGVHVRLLLDANDSAFGRHKYGIPNRQIAERFLEKKNEYITIKWCNTHGEQCHAKMLLATGGGKSSLLIGSANYTRRNLDKYNLESAILIESNIPMKAVTDAHQYFDRLWNNTKGETSVAAEVYRDRTSWKRVIAWVMEQTGLSTF